MYLKDVNLQGLYEARKTIVPHLISLPGIGKAMPHSTIIPTPNGDKVFGELVVGDLVYGSNGKPTKVTAIYEQGECDVWEVALNSKRRLRCHNQHLHRVKYYDSHSGKYKDKDVTTEELKLMVDNLPPSGHRRSVSFPITSAVQRNAKEHMIDPWSLGVLIGDGCLREASYTVAVSNSELDIIERFQFDNGLEDYSKHPKNYSYVWNDSKSFDMRLELDRLGLNYKYSHQKFIPDEYLNDSIENRFELLAGLLDTDGTVQSHIGDPTRNSMSYAYSTVSERLRDDVLSLVDSLGLKRNVAIVDKKDGHRPSYHIYINTDKVLVSSEKHLNKINPNTKRKSHVVDSVISVENTGIKEQQRCITVDAKDHLYLANDYIVTHNTSEVKRLAKDNGVKVVELIGSAFTPDTIKGVIAPDKEHTKAKQLQLEHFDRLEDGDILFIDECLQAQEETLRPLLNLITTRVLPNGQPMPDVFIIAASNLEGACHLSSQMQNRFIWFNIDFDKESWIEYMNDKYKLSGEFDEVFKRIQWTNEQDYKNADGFNNFCTPRSVDKYFEVVGFERIDKTLAKHIVNYPFNDLLNSYVHLFKSPIDKATEKLRKELTDMTRNVERLEKEAKENNIDKYIEAFNDFVYVCDIARRKKVDATVKAECIKKRDAILKSFQPQINRKYQKALVPPASAEDAAEELLKGE